MTHPDTQHGPPRIGAELDPIHVRDIEVPDDDAVQVEAHARLEEALARVRRLDALAVLSQETAERLIGEAKRIDEWIAGREVAAVDWDQSKRRLELYHEARHWIDMSRACTLATEGSE